MKELIEKLKNGYVELERGHPEYGVAGYFSVDIEKTDRLMQQAAEKIEDLPRLVNGKKSFDDLIERLNKGMIYYDSWDMYAVNERETKLLIAEAAEAIKLSEKRLAEQFEISSKAIETIVKRSIESRIATNNFSDIEKEILDGVYQVLDGSPMKDAFRQFNEVEAIMFLCNELYGKEFMAERNLEKVLIKLGIIEVDDE